MITVRHEFERSGKQLVVAATLAVLALVFSFPVAAWAQASVPTPSAIYSFRQASNDTVNVAGAIAQGQDGNMYGTGSSYGANNSGGVYKITPAGAESLLASFPVNWGYCNQGLTLGTDGNFYGICTYGNPATGLGSAFKVTAAGVFTDLYDFANASTGEAFPIGAPVLASDGNFYGMTEGSFSSFGAVYKLTSAGKLTILKSFSGGDADPIGRLIQGTDGNLYGALIATSVSSSYGGLFKISTAGGGYKVIYGFSASTTGVGIYPTTGVAQGTDGKLYGITGGSGANGYGTIFRVSTGGSSATVRHAINAPTDGILNTIMQATDGNYYGTAYSGGNGTGSVYELTSGGTFSSYLIPSTGALGTNPLSPVIQNTNGTVFGATNAGGAGSPDDGVFFSEGIGASSFASLVTVAGKVAAKIGILGQGFSTSSVVKFGGVQATTITVSGTTFITATVPTGALTAAVTVKTGTTTLTTPQTFHVTPTISTFTPTSGPVGTVVTINGTGLTQTTAVTFNGTAAGFSVVSDSQITATVPTGATTGAIKVTTSGGSVTSKTNFTVN